MPQSAVVPMGMWQIGLGDSISFVNPMENLGGGDLPYPLFVPTKSKRLKA
ncbi:hypothetical protein SAMN05421877_106126 [Sphingobacterium lactis]|uniref:Uncharacterized protein n=1 Tax=Sphingobacterium lactis TaxID=797291 RepID=A0A1H5YTD9_9SPHI|nr:hypothetical protein SAMN05421877_106126 [Sphingobacterium lactis]